MDIAPVLLIVFNRPSTTQKVFDRIREMRPGKLYIAADGPRPGNMHDQENCKKVLDIVNKVDWNCELHTDFSPINLGCRNRPSSAIDWIFKYESQAIILEDDCFPSMPFFGYCTELLKKYENDTRIMHIAGTNLFPEMIPNDDSYFFSQYQRPWGWATWKRAWFLFDIEMKNLENFKKKRYFDYLFSNSESKHWQEVFNRTKRVKTIWDYQWQFTIFNHNGLCIIPAKNLISNLGDSEGTHLSGPTNLFNQEIDENFFNQAHPEHVFRNKRYDNNLSFWYYTKDDLLFKTKAKIYRLLHFGKRIQPYIVDKF